MTSPLPPPPDNNSNNNDQEPPVVVNDDIEAAAAAVVVVATTSPTTSSHTTPLDKVLENASHVAHAAIPTEVLALPHTVLADDSSSHESDLSTLANDTIGMTVMPWDTIDPAPTVGTPSANMATTGGAHSRCREDNGWDPMSTTPVVNNLTLMGGRPCRVGDSYLAARPVPSKTATKAGMGVARRAAHDRMRRHRRIYLLGCIVGPFLVAVICGLTFGYVRLRKETLEGGMGGNNRGGDDLSPSPMAPPSSTEDSPVSSPTITNDRNEPSSPMTPPPSEDPVVEAPSSPPVSAPVSSPIEAAPVPSPTVAPITVTLPTPTPNPLFSLTVPPVPPAVLVPPTLSPTKSPIPAPVAPPPPPPTMPPSRNVFPPVNDIPRPDDSRFLPWSDLSDSQRNAAKDLEYNDNDNGDDEWDTPGTNPIEQQSYHSLLLQDVIKQPNRYRQALETLGISKDSWDCWVNHYTDYEWNELDDSIRQAWQALGWTSTQWQSSTTSSTSTSLTRPSSMNQPWIFLTPTQRAGALRLCFTQELWEQQPLSEWSRIVRARQDAVKIILTLTAQQHPTSQERLEEIQILLLEDTNSPQFRSLEWMTSDSNYFDYGSARVLQRWTLAVLALGWSDTAEAANNNIQLPSILAAGGWMQHDIHECDWFSTRPDDLCNENGFYERLDLRDMGLYGSLPVELIHLSGSLKWIYLQGNNFGGTIPTELGRLSVLDRFQMSFNRLEGTIPTEVGQMSSLKVFGVGRNLLEGPIPSEMGNMARLGTLGLERNSFTGTIPVEFGNLSRLDLLFLDYNELSGPVPTELANLDDLREAKLSYNDLSGSIPSGVCNLPDLEEFIVDCDEVSCTCCTECV